MGGVLTQGLRGPSSGSPTSREEGVAWSHAPVWKLGSLSRAVTPPQNPRTSQDPALLPLKRGRRPVICGCPELAMTHAQGEERVLVAVREQWMRRSGFR